MEIVNDNEIATLEASKKDPKAFEQIYNCYFDDIFLFVNQRLLDRERAFDITQQVFFNALIGLKSYKQKGFPFSSYLFKIAINECNQYFRDKRKVRYVSINEASLEVFSEDVLPIDHSEKAMEQLRQAIQGLKHDELFLIELRYFEQRSFKEIAPIVGLSENNCKVRVHRIIKKLKKSFKYEK